MHPLNGPAWSLYYEYIANILYALFIRRFNKIALTVLVVIAACFTVYRSLTAPMGDMVGGWALNWEQQYVGFVRLMYPFFGGLLLSRLGWLIRIKKRAFWYCALIIIVILSIPRLGGEEHYWMNGLYESFCIIFIFPIIVSMGAGGKVTGKYSSRICKFLGDTCFSRSNCLGICLSEIIRRTCSSPTYRTLSEKDEIKITNRGSKLADCLLPRLK